MPNELIYRIALTLIPHIGPVHAKILLQHLDVEEIFKAHQSTLEKIEGIGSVRAAAIRSFTGFSKAEEQLKFMEKYTVQPLFITDPDYPKRLLNCYDSPTLLYYKGSAGLNVSKILSIIGTRTHTDYGRQVTEKLIKELVSQNILVVSGLAFGIDAIAHRAAMKNNLLTVGVLAHGLDQVYPVEHTGLVKEMILAGGGILTEFPGHTKPDKHHFPNRNRIVAGMSDATIVIETDTRGGSMITAELANGYNRDVFAIPGKITDGKSAGCNQLIKNNKAILLTCGNDLVSLLGWEEKPRKLPSIRQKQLFMELNPGEKLVVDILTRHESVHIDEIYLKSGLSSSAVAAAVLSLELNNIVASLPGKTYRLR